MRVNENTAIATDTVLLVPYEAHHVPRYHSWMQDPDIREATASEELTLAEEFENQQSWRQAHDKLTFILCEPLPPAHIVPSQDGYLSGLITSAAGGGTADAEHRMLGDVNFFLYPHDTAASASSADGNDTNTNTNNDDNNNNIIIINNNVNGTHTTKDQRSSAAEILVRGEVDVMVAERAARGRGVGTAAVTALLAFVEAHMDTLTGEYAAGERARWGDAEAEARARRDDEDREERQRSEGSEGSPGSEGGEEVRVRMVGLMAKIKEGNESSLRLFRALGFEQDGAVDYFGEVKMVLPWGGHGGSTRWGGEAARLGYREARYETSL